MQAAVPRPIIPLSQKKQPTMKGIGEPRGRASRLSSTSIRRRKARGIQLRVQLARVGDNDVEGHVRNLFWTPEASNVSNASSSNRGVERSPCKICSRAALEPLKAYTSLWEKHRYCRDQRATIAAEICRASAKRRCHFLRAGLSRAAIRRCSSSPRARPPESHSYVFTYAT